MPESKRKRDEERARLVAAGALAALAIIAALLVIGRPRAPVTDARDVPAVSPVALSAANLQRFGAAVNACRTALDHAQIEIEPAPDVREGSCGYRGAVTLTQSLHPYSEPVTTSCALAAALVLWERDVVIPAAQRHLGQGVARIEMAGPAYSCRPIAGRSDGRMSEHARANAIDIRGFTLEDGARISVQEGWSGTPGERAFLREVRDGGCQLFQVTLSPDYNRAHRDHLHFDMGRWELCR